MVDKVIWVTLKLSLLEYRLRLTMLQQCLIISKFHVPVILLHIDNSPKYNVQILYRNFECNIHLNNFRWLHWNPQK